MKISTTIKASLVHQDIPWIRSTEHQENKVNLPIHVRDQNFHSREDKSPCSPLKTNSSNSAELVKISQSSFCLTFMKTSISGSGLIFADFSLLESSANMSADNHKKSQYPGLCTCHTTTFTTFKNKENKNERQWFRQTISISNTLASCREGQGFPYSHFSYMGIELTYVGSSSLGYKLIHAMTIVCHASHNLNKKFQFPNWIWD